MFKSIRDLFSEQLNQLDGPGSAGSAAAAKLAAAALLLEMTRADEQVVEAEEVAVQRALARAFELDEQALSELLELAHAERDAAVCLHSFTRQINSGLGQAEKSQIIESLWAVAFADGDLDHYEEHLVRKIADLLYIPHAEFIAAKLRVAERLNEHSV